jgi:hypothetical protein
MEGIEWEKIKDCYKGIEEDVKRLCHDCQIIIVHAGHMEKHKIILYERGERFKVKLSGSVSVTSGSRMVKTTTDLTRVTLIFHLYLSCTLENSLRMC